MSQETLNKILETVVYLKDKVDNEMVTKDEFAEYRNQILSHVDGFVKLHETLDQELVSLRYKYDRHEQAIKRIAEKVGVNLDF